MTAPPSLRDVDFLDRVGKKALQQNFSLMDPRYLDHSMMEHLARRLAQNGTGHFPQSAEYPVSESLKQCEERAFGYWESTIVPHVRAGRRVLIVAHANTIRALVKAIDHIEDEMIAHLKIPNGIPLIYTLDEGLEPVEDMTDDIGCQAKYLVSARNHGKVREFGRLYCWCDLAILLL